MKTQETFTTSVKLLAAYLLAKGLKIVRIEIIPQKYILDSTFHFPKEEAEELLKNQDRMVNFTELKVEHDLLCIEAVKAKDEFRKTLGGNS
jgi:hypothetical protein